MLVGRYTVEPSTPGKHDGGKPSHELAKDRTMITSSTFRLMPV
jgi:hypothetical protein